MMMSPTLVVAATCFLGMCIIAFVALRAWQGWLELKREELERIGRAPKNSDVEAGASLGAARIELADMKERIKKLEAIASGVEL